MYSSLDEQESFTASPPATRHSGQPPTSSVLTAGSLTSWLTNEPGQGGDVGQEMQAIGAEEPAQWLKTLTALSEVLSLDPSSNLRWLPNARNSKELYYNPLWPPRSHTHTEIFLICEPLTGTSTVTRWFCLNNDCHYGDI